MARAIVPRLNAFAGAVRESGGRVIWVTHANEPIGDGSDWNGFFDVFVAAEVRAATIEIVVLPPVPTDDWQVETIDDHIADVRQLYLDVLHQD